MATTGIATAIAMIAEDASLGEGDPDETAAVAEAIAVPPGYSVENLPAETVVAVPRQLLSDEESTV